MGLHGINVRVNKILVKIICMQMRKGLVFKVCSIFRSARTLAVYYVNVVQTLQIDISFSRFDFFDSMLRMTPWWCSLSIEPGGFHT